MKRSMVLGATLAPLLASLAFIGCDDESSSGSTPGDAEDASTAETGSEASIGDAGATSDVVDAAIPFDGAPVPIRCSVPSCVIALAAGAEHYCATMEDRSVRCWGDTNALALPPDGGAIEPGKPSIVSLPTSIASLALAGDGTCALDTAGAVWCWRAWERTPTRVPDIPTAARVFMGPDGQTRCILDPSSALVCWGDSELGQGIRTMDLRGARPDEVALGTRVGFAITNGNLFSWGYGIQLGHPYSGTVPMPIFGLAGAEALAVGAEHVCVRTGSGELFCWGRGGVGELGTGIWRDEVTPARVALPGSAAAHSIATTAKHSCVRTTASEVYCWGGTNTRGELGLVAKRGVYGPTRVDLPAGAPAASVAVGRSSSCALRTDGSVLCWGDNTLGQLGRGAPDERRHPEPQPVVFP